MITQPDLIKLFPRADKTLLFFLSQPEVYKESGCETNIQIAHFLSQFGFETGGFRHLKEIISTEKAERQYGVGTRVGRILGNTKKGDGAKFIGRGLCMLTGRWNYTFFGKQLGLDLVNSPELLEFPSYAVDVAIAFWLRRGLTESSKHDNVEIVTRKINGGINGLLDRTSEFNRVLNYLNSRDSASNK